MAAHPTLLYRELKPALLAGDTRGFDAVRGTQLADGFREIVAYRTLGEEQLLGDVTAAHAFASQPQHLPLPVVERILRVPGFRRQFRRDGLAAALHRADR